MRSARLLAALSLLVLAMTNPAEAADGAWCEHQWQLESADAAASVPPRFAELVERWRSYEPRCAGTVAWEGRLAIAYLLAGDTARARGVVKAVSTAGSEFAYVAEFASLLCDYFDVMNGPSPAKGLGSLEREFSSFVGRYPAFPDGHAILGGIQSARGEHADAVRSLEMGRRSSMNTSGVYQNLTISYAALARYDDALTAADEAVRRDRSAVDNPWFACAVARSQAAVGKLRQAETVLRVIAAKHPEVRRDSEFKSVVDFVAAKIEASKAPAKP